MSPFYRRIPAPLPFISPQVTVDQLGALLVGGVVAGTAVHGVASYVRQRRSGGHGGHGESVRRVRRSEHGGRRGGTRARDRVRGTARRGAGREDPPAAGAMDVATVPTDDRDEQGATR